MVHILGIAILDYFANPEISRLENGQGFLDTRMKLVKSLNTFRTIKKDHGNNCVQCVECQLRIVSKLVNFSSYGL
jgi:hypothetical protein